MESGHLITSMRYFDFIRPIPLWVRVCFDSKHFLNPNRPPNNAGLELAPVPMRHRNTKPASYKISDQETIYKVLKVDGFKIKDYQQSENLVGIDVTNTKFRSVAQAVGRIVSTLQRFTSDDIKEAVIVFHRNNLQLTHIK